MFARTIFTLLVAFRADGFRIAKKAKLTVHTRGSCVWRQTGQCSVDGLRQLSGQPRYDKTCDSSFETGNTGFCDCNGNNVLDPAETGWGCSGPDRGTCNDICQGKWDGKPRTPVTYFQDWTQPPVNGWSVPICEYTGMPSRDAKVCAQDAEDAKDRTNCSSRQVRDWKGKNVTFEICVYRSVAFPTSCIPDGMICTKDMVPVVDVGSGPTWAKASWAAQSDACQSMCCSGHVDQKEWTQEMRTTNWGDWGERHSPWLAVCGENGLETVRAETLAENTRHKETIEPLNAETAAENARHEETRKGIKEKVFAANPQLATRRRRGWE